MRLLALLLSVLVVNTFAQQHRYASAPFTPIAPFRYSPERVITQGRISTGVIRDDDFDEVDPIVVRPPSHSLPARPSRPSSSNPCSPSPCGPNTRCEVSRARNVALCRCIGDYVPDGNTINGCKPQCTGHDECPDDHRCQGEKCVRVCVTGACGHKAECYARNHQADCRCPDNHRGNPYTSCEQEEREAPVLPPAPPRDPCDGNPCGFNADCRSRGDRPVCSCPPGYEGDPLTNCIRGECIEHRDCPHYQVCKGLRCIDPCSESPCGRNAECVARNHQPVCSCPRGYTGNALEFCRVFDSRELCNPSPCGNNTNCRVRNERAVCSCIENYIGNPLTGCRPECVYDSDCPQTNMACQNNLCVNPCRDACGENAYCDVRARKAVCSCPQYYKGEPYSRCYPECTDHEHCPSHQACIDLQCGDPCVGVCGIGANCKVENHRPICSCPKTHTGDPFEGCRPFTSDDYCTPNPCGDGAQCTPGHDRSGDMRPVCTCRSGYIGNPLISCKKGECERHEECPQHQACYQFMCRSPCYTLEGKSVCGDDAQCNVKNHLPVCSCPGGYDGNPLQRCYIDDSRRRFTSFRRNK